MPSPDGRVDLRSDTVTRPTPAMRKAMAEAEVGDDVYGEDPTVVRLQEKVAGLLGFEAALWVPSGVMANEIAIRVLTRPGQEVLAEERSHVVQCAPAGSVLASTRARIEEARRVRKQLGGGMRQVGILAAAGLVGVETMIDRLAEDHARASTLAASLAACRGVRVLPVRTNIVVAE